LKESLGTSSDLLARFTEAVFREVGKPEANRFRDVWIRSLPYRGKEPIEVKVTVRSLAKELTSKFHAP
jgi:hypothetical protein